MWRNYTENEGGEIKELGRKLVVGFDGRGKKRAQMKGERWEDKW